MADNIFSALHPLMTVTRLIGLAPFRISSSKNIFAVCLPALVYSGLMLILFVANAVFLIYIKFVNKDKRIDSYIGLASDVILLTSGIVVTVCCILLSMIQRKNYVKVVSDFYSIGFEMAKLNLTIPYKKMRTFSRRQLFILFVVLVLLFVHTFYYTQNLSLVIYASYLYAWFAPKLFNFLMESQFISGVLLLKSHFQLLNKSLEEFDEIDDFESDEGSLPAVNYAWVDYWHPKNNNKKLLHRNFKIWENKIAEREGNSKKVWTFDETLNSFENSLNKIKIIRKIHSSLCETVKYLNLCFSLQLLTSVAQSFIFITANLYMIFVTISSFTKFAALTLSFPIIWFVTHTIELVIIVLTCTNTSKTANYTAVLVHKILSKNCRPELRNQLKLFSNQLLHRKVCFTASGFFNLDMTLLQGVIGAATTYLVILIQFHNTYEVAPDIQ